MWEQVSWYGMRSLLVFYLTMDLRLPQSQASVIYGTYAASAYLTPLLGGIACDRFLGRRRSVLLGGFIMAAGHFLMTLPGAVLPALALIALGTGLFVPSLPSQVGALYREDDPRRLAAYNVYYIGVNLGAFLAPLVCGTLGEMLGWQWGFGAAGIGMLLGVGIYLLGSRHLTDEAPFVAAKNTGPAFPRARIIDLALIALVVALFRGAYEQVGNTVALWTDSAVDRHIGPAFTIPRTWFQSLNPLVVFIGGPLLAWLWTRRAKARRATSSIRKMATGAGLVGCAYVMLAVLSWDAQTHAALTGWPWLVAFFVVFTLGELFILPVGLSLFGRLAPPHFAATTIACWFATGFIGNLLAGVLGTQWRSWPHSIFFFLIAALAFAAAMLLLTFDRRTREAESAPGALLQPSST
jgi:POT family proton-dependent oligopeptide transporter